MTRPHQINTDDYALVVGINHYPHFENLRSAIKDAEDMLAWLRDEPDGGGLPDDNCLHVYSTEKSERPAQDEVDDAIAKIFKLVIEKEQARRLYVYFSGHGMAPSKLVTGLCVANWSSEFRDRALNSQEYLDSLLSSGRFREVILFFDCCRVRMVAARGRGPGNPTIYPPGEASNSRSFQANATEFLNKAFEGRAGKEEAEVRGYFTKALLEGLRGAAAVKPFGVPASELKRFLEQRTPEVALAGGVTQVSEIINGLPSENEPVFGRAKPKGSGSGPISAQQSPIEESLEIGKFVTLSLLTAKPGAHAHVRDQSRKLVFSGRVDGEKRLRLLRGKYTVSGHVDGASMELPLQLTRSLQVQLFDPRFYTAATLAGSPSSHEYYTYPSMDWSRTETRRPLDKKADSSIFIFVRAASRESHKRGTDLSRGFSLLNEKYEKVSDFRVEETKRDDGYGWLAFHVAARQGFYYLRSLTHPAWETSLQLFRGFQTQVFLMYREGILFETMKIFLQAGKGFEPRDREATAVDVALNGIQNHTDLLDPSTLDLLLHGKFENPMLGLVGAHVLLQKKDVKNRAQIVLSNLGRLLPNSSDVAALELVARVRNIQPSHRFKNRLFNYPPMLRAGLDAVFVQSAKHPSTIGSRSYLPEIAVNLYAGTPWSVWVPRSKRPSAQLSWVHLAILDEVRAATKKEKPERFEVEQFALQIGVPPQTVRSAFEDLRNHPSALSLPVEFRRMSLFAKTKASGRASKPSKSSR